MTAYGQQMAQVLDPRHAPRSGFHVGGGPVAAPGIVAPVGTFAPGTKIQVGGHRVVIQKYLSEGGFAHVYLVKMPQPVDGTDAAVLKRVAVPDKEALRSMRIEVETMKRLKGHRPIVTYIDSHASELKGGGYEVFLLMEYCNGGGLIDFMNTRLQHRLTEPEILDIFSDIAEGVACMHYLKPPLLHRDLKVENVLITSRGSTRRFKLCDFGSAAPPRAAPTTVVECRLMDEDVQKYTTLQYRSPEMVDVYRKQPMDEKCDIWALGVLLYKLCYYTTPFEDQGQLAILNASYKFPSHPVFSDRLKRLIASMLQESMEARPNIYQVLKESSSMRGREVPIKDIYGGKPQSEHRGRERLPSKEQTKQPAVGAVFSPPPQEQQSIPNIKPMRRGRPTASPAPKITSQGSKNPSPAKAADGDPFAALDAKGPRKGDSDELSERFPKLDQFSLLHNQGSKFEFDSSPTSPPSQQPAPINQRVAERLADEAFAPRQAAARGSAVPRPKSTTPMTSTSNVLSPQPDLSLSKVPSAPSQPDVSRAQTIISKNPELRAISSQKSSRYVSTGTSTVDLPAERTVRDSSKVSTMPVESQSDGLPTQAQHNLGHRLSGDLRSLPNPRVSTFQTQSRHERQPSPSKVSLDGGRPESLASVSGSIQPSSRQRPASTNLESSSLEFLREKETSRQQSRSPRPPSWAMRQTSSPSLKPAGGDDALAEPNDLDFLRSMEDQDGKHQDKSKSSKRSSLTSLSGSRHMLSGKFGDAFKRFEGSPSASKPADGRTPSPLKDTDRGDLTPIAGSEALDGRSDDGEEQDEDQMSPEMRRELERRRLEEEEQRVATAQAEYRRRVAQGGPASGSVPIQGAGGGVHRAATIQNRVQSLLSEEQRPATVQRTAQGYGKYSDAATASAAAGKPEGPPAIRRKPITVSKGPTDMRRGPVPGGFVGPGGLTGTTSAPPTMAANGPSNLPSKPGVRPPAPKKKPVHLNSFPAEPRPGSPRRQSQPLAQWQQQPQQQPQLVATDLPGQPALNMTARERDSYVEDFTKRFPSLGSIEMVEREIGRENGGPAR